MKSIGTAMAALLLAAIVASAGYGIFAFYKLLATQWSILNDDWKASLIILTAILILCILFILASIRSYIKKLSLISAGKVLAYEGKKGEKKGE
jgi:hypothetical protein